MNKLNLLSGGIFGDAYALQNLGKVNKASLLLVSDTHNNPYDLESVILQYGESVDALLFAGDGLEDLLNCMTNSMYDKQLQKALPSIIAMVPGNCDAVKYVVNFTPMNFENTNYSDHQQMLEFPEYAMLKVCGQKIFLSHGHLFNVDIGVDRICYVARNKNCNVIVHGHTHYQLNVKKDMQTVINPGSLVSPRRQSFAGFGILSIDDTANISVDFIKYFRSYSKNKYF